MDLTKNGGGGRDRTDDLKLAKLPLSQLSYAPDNEKWWAWEDLNFRPHAYQACALTGLSYRPEWSDHVLLKQIFLVTSKNIMLGSGKLERDTKTAADISALSIVKV